VKTLHVRRKGDMATLQFLTEIIDVREQSVRLTQCIHVYTFDDEWPPASVRACARNIDDHRDPFAAHKGIYLELNVAAMRRKGNSKYPFNSLIRKGLGSRSGCHRLMRHVPVHDLCESREQAKVRCNRG